MEYLNYISVLRYSDCTLRNSSSCIIEAPSFNVGTINIRDTQIEKILKEY